MGAFESYKKIRSEIPAHVTIVLACKGRTPREVEEAIVAGATDLGENYVQEAERTVAALGERATQVRWHMIGDLQTNKINKALRLFDVIQTVDSLKKARAVDVRAARIDEVIPVYIEVNIGSEFTKAGVAPDYHLIEQLVREMSELEHIRVKGLMTMGPLRGDPEDSRPDFAKAKKIFDRIRELHLPRVEMETLSMGMTNSHRIAIQEGATMIRSAPSLAAACWSKSSARCRSHRQTFRPSTTPSESIIPCGVRSSARSSCPGARTRSRCTAATGSRSAAGRFSPRSPK